MTTVLVVDDSPVSQRLLGYTLQRNGYTVLTASDGRAALALLQRADVDLIISDLSMPEMDGITLLRHIRADNRYCAVQLIMLTASGQDQDRLDAEAAGASYFLTKPASSSELLATVRRVLL